MAPRAFGEERIHINFSDQPVAADASGRELLVSH